MAGPSSLSLQALVVSLSPAGTCKVLQTATHRSKQAAKMLPRCEQQSATCRQFNSILFGVFHWLTSLSQPKVLLCMVVLV